MARPVTTPKNSRIILAVELLLSVMAGERPRPEIRTLAGMAITSA